MKILELEELLPRLNESAKDVDSWAEEFIRLMKLANITAPASIHTWAMECVEGKSKGVLQDLVSTDEEGNEKYPSIKEMKTALEESLEVTPQTKCKRLQKLKIYKNETIKNFNWRYNKLYSSLPRLYQEFITVDDYVESISSRPFARAQVITNMCTTLQEAFEEAELAERAEGSSTSNNNETVLTTLFSNNAYYRRDFSQHPFRFFGNNHQNRLKSKYFNKASYKTSWHNNPDEENKAKRDNVRRVYSCYKCYETGHVMKNCPYTYKELAEMEESGKIEQNKNSLNY